MRMLLTILGLLSISYTAIAQVQTWPSDNEIWLDDIRPHLPHFNIPFRIDVKNHHLTVLVSGANLEQHYCTIPSPFDAEDQKTISIQTVCISENDPQEFKLDTVPAGQKVLFFSAETCQNIPFTFDNTALQLHLNSKLPLGCYGMAYSRMRLAK